ncbi:mobile element-associated protein [Staphylococcus aureus]|nr:mobile element-associated protein [Staphylococcus aureus]
MNWEIKNLMCDLKILKEKFEDLKDNHGSHFEDLYLHEPNHTLNKDDVIKKDFHIMRDVFTMIKCLICYFYTLKNSMN